MGARRGQPEPQECAEATAPHQALLEPGGQGLVPQAPAGVLSQPAKGLAA